MPLSEMSIVPRTLLICLLMRASEGSLARGDANFLSMLLEGFWRLLSVVFFSAAPSPSSIGNGLPSPPSGMRGASLGTASSDSVNLSISLTVLPLCSMCGATINFDSLRDGGSVVGSDGGLDDGMGGGGCFFFFSALVLDVGFCGDGSVAGSEPAPLAAAGENGFLASDEAGSDISLSLSLSLVSEALERDLLHRYRGCS
mmetsp:Transcript_18489/g.35361  ORF Transcript_18489/g.35361 Transcript_18489/m.35361 type:complete len:200 (+) Transcript_18489:1597-2196(+)